MATVTFKGNPVKLVGDLPQVGENAIDFNLVGADLSEVSLAVGSGKKIVLNIFPSIDTPVCAASVRRFNQEAASLSDTVVLCISADLPFAQARFCGGEGLDKVHTLSTFRNPSFGEDYGIAIAEGPLKGLLARAVVIIDENGIVKYAQLVPEIAEEPDYESALASLG